MYKLVTNDSLIHPLISLPFEDNLEVMGVKTKVLCIPFGTEYDTIKKVKEVVTDTVKMGIIHVFDETQLVREYKNYYTLQQICTATYNVNGNNVEILMAKMSQVSTIPEQIEELRNLIEKSEKSRTELATSFDELRTQTTENAEESNNTIKQILTHIEETNTNVINFVNETKENINSIMVSKEESSKKIKEVIEASNNANKRVSEMSKDVETVNRNVKTIIENEGQRNEAISNIEDTINILNVKINGVNEDDMDIDQLKDHRIALSKSNLRDYLAVTTVSCNVHGGVMAEYSITEEKQTQLMAMIMMATMNPEYQPSWNAKGEPCSYDWTVDELKYLASQIEAVVRPLVSRQQHMETDIKNATTIDEVKDVNITF